MAFSLHQVMNRSDWIKLLVLLGVAMVAWYLVLQEYTKPFSLSDDIRRQQMIDVYEVERSTPLFSEPGQ